MDKLEAEIAKAKREAAELRRRAEEKELEAKTLMRAAKLRPPPTATIQVQQEPEDSAENMVLLDADTHAQRGGRQKGAISKQWRAVLWGMYGSGRNMPHTLEEVELLADSAGLKLQAGSTLARLKNYEKLGYVAEASGMYSVTKTAVAQFDLHRTPEDAD